MPCGWRWRAKGGRRSLPPGARGEKLFLTPDSSLTGSKARLRERWVYEVLDLCLMCKACKAECPSNVDMAKLKAEFLQQYYERRPRPLAQHLMGRIYQFNRLGALAALR